MAVSARKSLYMVSVYSAAHFFVDFACAFLMFRAAAGTPDWNLSVLLYNFCAFAMQMPMGVLADKWGRNYLFAAAGCVLVGAAYGLWQIPAAAAVTAGIGNGLFHIGGGVDVLNISGEKSGALGVFVSPGAFGIYFGTILGKSRGLPSIAVLLALFAAAVMILAVRRARGEAYPQNAVFSLGNTGSLRMLLAASCLFLVVCLRSTVGLTLSFPWKNAGWGFVLVCAAAFGKASGGFIADRLGAVRTAVFSLGFAALLFLFPQVPPAGIIAVLLFNMTMPITLWAMAKIFPGAKGFSFGLLTFGLFLGFLPAHFGLAAVSGVFWVFTLAAVASLLLLWAGLRKANI